MNIVLLITVTLTLALVLGSQGVAHNVSSNLVSSRYNQLPCQKNYDNNAYNRFVQRHILQESFNRQSKPEWRKYLQRYRLCNRPRQSFIEKTDQQHVLETCNGYGRRLNSYSGNLCKSASDMVLYHVTVDNNCKIKRIQQLRRYVIVACDKIKKRCRPVHFENYSNRGPNTKAERCRLRA